MPIFVLYFIRHKVVINKEIFNMVKNSRTSSLDITTKSCYKKKGRYLLEDIKYYQVLSLEVGSSSTQPLKAYFF